MFIYHPESTLAHECSIASVRRVPREYGFVHLVVAGVFMIMPRWMLFSYVIGVWYSPEEREKV